MMFRDTALTHGDAFMMLFAINSVSSWYSLKELRNKIVRENDGDESIPMVIVANKKVSAIAERERGGRGGRGERERWGEGNG